MEARTNLYLLQSPLQVLNAYEWRLRNPHEENSNDVVVVFDQRCARNNEIVLATLQQLSWKPSLVLSCKTSVVGRILTWLRLRNFVKGVAPIHQFVLGAYDAGLMVAAANLYPKASVVLVDDGTNSLVFPQYRYHGVRGKYQKRDARVPALGFDTRLPEAMTFFSIYDLDLKQPDLLEKNELSFLRANVRYDDRGPVFFIGSILPEAGWVSFEEYFHFVERIKEHFGGREFHYFPHRREDLWRKQNALDNLHIQIVQPNVPFELHLTTAAAAPSVVAGFYSTIFDTLRVAGLAQDDRLLSFALPAGCITDETEAMVAAACYEKYRRSGSPPVNDLLL
jgi:hypothetical protein